MDQLVIQNQKIEHIATAEGEQYRAVQYIICAGNSTPHLVPDLKRYMKVTGHPVFHIKPSEPELFDSSRFPVFAADISNTGWYGFPLHPLKKVVQIANHSEGLLLNPLVDEREVYDHDIASLRQFLRKSLPALADDPIVYTRRCCYTDTLDGHFWIDQHPVFSNLIIGSGGSGHGFKMGPIIGELIAKTALGEAHRWSDRYRWRSLDHNTIQQEAARNN